MDTDVNNTPTKRQEGRARSRETRDRTEGSLAREAGKQAVHKEGDVKQDMGPSVSMTVVGNDVTFTQNFNF